jgi:16S rRNA (cytosine1402-N4)-methyltransferase
MQIDRPERGFSYAVDAPLDMRMDPTSSRSAADVVNDADERELETIFRRFGEERYARPIARAIARRRRERPFERTGELVETIRAAMPAPARFGDGHPAKRVFQALRIAVNDELGSLERALPAAVEMLRPGGRLAVISFHSLEDRLVKNFLRQEARGCVCPPEFPVCVCGREPVLRLLTKKAVRPSQREVAANPRAGSARLRAAARV